MGDDANNTTTTTTMTDEAAPLQTPYLIVGAGPAGAALACFLGDHGLTGLLVAAAPGTAHTPRAHITSPAGLECLRDLPGLEDACVRAAAGGASMEHTRWCLAMAGEELARAHSWGHDPRRRGDYAAASPCAHVDLPQTELEPILVTRAARLGWRVRFDTRLAGFERRPAKAAEGEGKGEGGEVVVSELRDGVTGRTYRVESKYLFGCDGARSQVVRGLGIPLDKKPGQGLALNVLVRADMSHLIEHRTGNLHWVFQPDGDYPPWGWASLVRMVKPWKEWMFIMMPRPGADLSVDHFSPTHEECIPRIRELIGDDSVDVEVLDISKWWINETVAEYYSVGNM